MRDKIVLADGRHRDDGPVNPVRHRQELGLRIGVFDHEDHVPQDPLQQEHKKLIYADRAGTAMQGLTEHAGFVNEFQQLELPQDAPELEHLELYVVHCGSAQKNNTANASINP